MSRLTVEVRCTELAELDEDWEFIEFHGDFRIDSICVGSRGETTLNLLSPEARDILIYKNRWTIWVIDDEAYADEKWERLWPESEQEAHDEG